VAEKPPTTPGSDTIAAVATAPGRGGIGVVRISGHGLLPLAEALSGKSPQPRVAMRTDFLADDGSVIDTGLLLYFPAPRSFTGEDVVELHGHGGNVILHMLLARCLDLGARLAEPGEFTRRAYLNGKLDLAQAEAVIDLVDAMTAAAAKGAIRSLRGEFSAEICKLRDQLVELRTLVEAALDFPDEEIELPRATEIREWLERLQAKTAEIASRAQQGRLLQSGLSVVIAGRPNVGKSSLLNRLADDELAIVTPLAGTTRDAIRITLQIEGVPLRVVDTAGLRDAFDEIERIGIERAWREIENADIVLLLVDAREGVREADEAILARLPAGSKRIIAHNKIDLTERLPEWHEDGSGSAIWLSARTGDGIDLLQRELLRIAGWHPDEPAFIARERHLRALARTLECLQAAHAHPGSPELLAEELRLAQRSLGAITGEISSDDLLGEIFGRFCIGK
jgi:tRNA modification GTPase